MGVQGPTHSIPPWRGWAPVFGLPIAVLLLAPREWPRWLLVWLLAIAILAGCKWLTWRRTSVDAVPWWRHAGYLLAWPGMDAAAFLRSDPQAPQHRPTFREWGLAGGKTLLGTVLFWDGPGRVSAGYQFLAGWVGMIGVVLLLHFGAFHLLSCAWRSIGVSARPLMNRPLAAVSVSEFWGRRWNRAFRDLTYRFFFRPLSASLGPRSALTAGFLVSGLVHELVITVPAGGGYGGPTFFFLCQAAAVAVEHSPLGRSVGLGSGWRGRAFTAFALTAPLCWLFPPAFVANVVVPFLGAIGAL